MIKGCTSLPGLKLFRSLMECRNDCCRIISLCGVSVCVADGDDVVVTLKTASMLYISFSASAIVVSSGRVVLHFMLRRAILCFSIRVVSSVRVRLEYSFSLLHASDTSYYISVWLQGKNEKIVAKTKNTKACKNFHNCIGNR